MAEFWHIVRWLVVAGEFVLLCPVLYLCAVSLSAIRAQRKFRGRRAEHFSTAGTLHRFAILIPAHNEESVIAGLLESISHIDYPRECVQAFVIADNCSDRTAEVAKQFAGVEALERFDPAARGKGYALNWAWQQLADWGLVHDAYVVIDADSVVNKEFLQAMNRELAGGARALQSQNMVLNATASPSAALRWVALALMNYVRPLGRNGLGGSATLSGNGMCLSQALVAKHPWRAFGLGEDYQYYLSLIEQGERVTYVPEAAVRSQMPLSFAQMRTQDVRWETAEPDRSRWQRLWKMLSSALHGRSWVHFDAALEYLTPPLSLLVCCTALVTVAAILLGGPVAMGLASLLVAGMGLYVATPFYLLRPPASVYKSLLHAPRFMLWKIWVILVLSKRRKHTQEWIRTARNPS